MSKAARYDEQIVLPRAIRFPIELIPPDGFDEERLETWPRVVGRLEYVEGRLLYMPPCGDEQQEVVTDVVITVGAIVLPAARQVVVKTAEESARYDRGALLPQHPSLPGLEPRVDDFFVQLSDE